jgi:hypothetical protein
MEFYSATKKNEILSFAAKWMELENIISSKVSQAQKAKNHMFYFICGFLDMGQTHMGRTHRGEIGKGKET